MTFTPDIQMVEEEAHARRCHPLMVQLRPHLTSEDEFVSRWHRQSLDGYRLLALHAGSNVLALAGYRVQENLVSGRHMYVDDLVTDACLRGSGHGAELMTRLKQDARLLGCTKLLLDTPLSNALGQRFYFRQGLLATALRFSLPIAAEVSLVS
ncbi:GNAT family N-acetyltransferase [Metallibacterium scheffleri]|uniref:GNAT family N-acetyltransferase n=2 Tax=Metallibacterium scheffleri TaxID=993689 RepID=A0A4S3KR17_9GAMM|nr:GNAT family N-acetyltransferase [Metallibacterium scheffleri]